MMMHPSSRRPLVFRLLLIGSGTVLLLILAASAVFSIQYFRMRKDPPPAEIVSDARWIGGPEAPLGDIRVCRTVIRTPWGSVPEKPSVSPGQGTQLVAEPEFTPEKFSWGFTRWALDLPLQPYRTGETGKGSVLFSFRGPDGNAVLFEQTIPPLSVSEIRDASADCDLAVAGEVAEEGKRSLLPVFLAAAVLLLAVLILAGILFLRRRRSGTEVQPVWKIALEQIAALRKGVADGMRNAGSALAELTDIVRHFLEARYLIHAERQTTVEFLRELNRADSPLPDADRRFLRSFLEAADMVKFARMQADPEMFDNAAVRAEKLVENAREAEAAERRKKP